MQKSTRKPARRRKAPAASTVTVKAGARLARGQGVAIEDGVAVPPTKGIGAALAPPAIDVAMLERIGTALYGSRWQAELAAGVGVNVRMVHFILDGTRAVSARVAGRLVELLAERRAEIAAIEEALGVTRRGRASSSP